MPTHVDVRLVPAAVTAWIITAISLNVTRWWSQTLLALFLTGLVLHLLATGSRRIRPDLGTVGEKPQPRVRSEFGYLSDLRAVVTRFGSHILIICLVSTVCLGSALVQGREVVERSNPASGKMQSAAVALTLKITSEPKRDSEKRRWSALAEVQESWDGPRTIRVFARGDAQPPWQSTVRASGKTTDPFGGVLGFSASSVSVTQPSPWWVGWSHKVRAALVAACEGLSEQGRGLVPGISIGDTSALDPDLEQAMTRSGLTHLTAVSGSHFAILGALAWSILGLMKVPVRARAITMGLIFMTLVVLVRPEPSVIRAAVMAGIGLLGVLLNRRSSAIPTLAASILALVLIQPELSISLGFTLSVVATAGIVLLSPRIESRLGFLPAPIRMPVAVAVAAQLPCAPVIVLVDPHVAVWAIPANVIAGLAVAPATVLGALTTLLAVPLPDVAVSVAHAASVATWWIAKAATVCAGLPGAQIPWLSGLGGVLALTAVSVAGYAGWHFAPDARWLVRRTLRDWKRNRCAGRNPAKRAGDTELSLPSGSTQLRVRGKVRR